MNQLHPKEKYSMFVGYWQSLDDKNSLLIEKKLKEGKKVLICIMDNDVNEKTPLTSDEVEFNIKKHMWKYLGDGRLKTIKIPNIESINFGSILDYEVIFHEEMN